MTSRLSIRTTPSGSVGGDYTQPELRSRKPPNSQESLDRSGASKASDSVSSSGGSWKSGETWKFGKSSRRPHLKIPSSFLKGSPPPRGSDGPSRPQLRRQDPPRAPKPGITRKVAGLFKISQLSDVLSNLERYEQRKQALDTRTSSTIGKLRSRIEERMSELADTKTLLTGRFLGLGVPEQIEDITKQVVAEDQSLSKVYRLVNEAEDQQMAISLPLNDLMYLVKEGVDTHSILVGMANGMNAYTIRQLSERYAELGIPFNEHTLPSKEFCDANAVANGKRQLGSGAMNTVWLIPYREPGTEKIHEMVFKPELDAPDVNTDAVLTGIGREPTVTKSGALRFTENGKPKAANLASRAVATSRLNDLLELSVVPKTFYSVENGQVGTVMGLAHGRTPVMFDKTAPLQLDSKLADWLRKRPDVLLKYAAAQGYSGVSLRGDDTLVLRREGGGERDKMILGGLDFSNPLLLQQLAELQFFDALCGQVDRNSQNFFWDGERLYAIDNDLSFGQAAEFGRERCPPLPTVISADLRNRLLTLDEADLRATLSPLLDQAEVDATVRRWRLVQEALNKTGDDAIMVISSAEGWQSSEVKPRLGVGDAQAHELTNNQIRDASAKGYAGREWAMQAVTRWENQQVSEPGHRIPVYSPDKVRQELSGLHQAAQVGA